MRRGRPRHDDILTPREWEVLDLLREGLTNEQIASRLSISPDTAKFHVSEILSKLGVESRAEAAQWHGKPRVLPGVAIPAAVLRRVKSLSPLQLAGAVAIAVVAVGLVGLAIGAVLMSSRSGTDEQPAAVEPYTGDEALDAMIDSLLKDDADSLAARFAGSAPARKGALIGGPIGLYQAQDVPADEWTSRLGASVRSLHAVVQDPREPFPWWDQPPLPQPRAAVFDGARDFDIVLVVEETGPPGKPWRFSILDGRIVDVVIDNGTGPNGGNPYGPLPRRLGYLTPSPDDEPGSFLVLPPEEYWPIPQQVDRVEPGVPGSHRPANAPNGRTSDPELDGVIETLLNGNTAALEGEFSDVAARLERCVPIPGRLGVCSTEYERLATQEWIQRFAASDRTLYAVLNRDPIDVIIAADSGQGSADGWRFGVREGKLVDVRVSFGEPQPNLPPGVGDPHFFWQEARSFTPDPGFDYDEFLVLPPPDQLPRPPPAHPLSARTGNTGIDALLILLDSRDVQGLVDAFVTPGQVSVMVCRGQLEQRDAAFIESWSADTAQRALSLHTVANVPDGYPIAADHLIEVVLEETPLLWRTTAMLETDGRIVGLIAGENCYPGFTAGKRSYVIPPLDPGPGQYDSSRRSGVPIVDAILDAMQSGEESDWQGLVVYHGSACGYDYSPPCPPGSQPGTPVESFPISACHGGYTTRDDPPRPHIGGEAGDELYAVVEGPDQAFSSLPGEDGRAWVILTVEPDSGRARAISVSDEGMTSIRSGCGPNHSEWLTPQGDPDYLLPPP